MFVTIIKCILIFGPIVLKAEVLPLRSDKDGHTNVIKELNSTNFTNVEDPALPKFAPRFTRPDRMYGVYTKVTGSFIRLRCKVEGNPAPNIAWLKNKEPITRPYTPPHCSKWSMTLEDLTKADSGEYSCVACNELGCVNHTAQLKVQEIRLTKPYIENNYPGNITASLHDTVNFSCPVTTDLEPYIYWTWRSLNTTEAEVESDSIDDQPEKLTIYNVTAKNEGWYKCIAMNTLGSDSAEGYLRVVSDTVNNTQCLF